MMIKTPEGEKSVASAGLGGAALGLAIPGTVALVNQLTNGGGLLGGLFNGGNGCNAGNVVSALESALAQEKAERYTDQAGTEVYKQFAKERNDIQAQISAIFAAIAQMDKHNSVAEAINNERISCLTGSVNNIYDAFKLVIPNSSVCPGWGNVTITPAATTTTA
jgi:hypothetical protein